MAGEVSFEELQDRADRDLGSIVRLDGSPVGFPVYFCQNPLCENYTMSVDSDDS